METEIVSIMFNICYSNSYFLFLCQNDEPIDTEIKNFVEPQLITLGKLSCLDPVYIGAEAGDGCMVTTTWTSLILLVGSYYMFMEYPSWSKNFFLPVETVLMDICKERKKGMAIENWMDWYSFEKVWMLQLVHQQENLYHTDTQYNHQQIN